MNLQNLFKQFSNLGNQNINNGENRPFQGNFSSYPEPYNTPNFQNTSYNSNNSMNNMNNSMNNNINNNTQNQPQNFLSGLFGPNFNFSTLLPFLSLLKGKQGLSSMLSADKLPDNLKSFAPLISMFSKSSDDKSNDEKDDPKIDSFKKIED